MIENVRTVKNFQNSFSQESCIQSQQLLTVKRVACSQESCTLTRQLDTVVDRQDNYIQLQTVADMSVLVHSNSRSELKISLRSRSSITFDLVSLVGEGPMPPFPEERAFAQRAK